MAANRRKGKALVGNIRYPWITRVAFAPRNGYATRETVQIEYVDGLDSTKPACSLTIHLDNRTDANRVARHIIDKVIAYRYATGGPLSEEFLERYETLRTSGLMAAPQKGFMSIYNVPTSWKVPNGVDNPPTSMPPFPATRPAVSGDTSTTANAVEPTQTEVAPEPLLDAEPVARVCTSCGSAFVGTAFCTDCGAPLVAA
jgi:hypothetical protein